MARVRYQPTWKLLFDGRLMYANAGENKYNKDGTLVETFGNVPMVPNDFRKREYGYFTTEGVNAKTLLISLDASYQFYHNMFADIHVLARKKESADPSLNENTFFIGGGLRINLGNYRSDF